MKRSDMMKNLVTGAGLLLLIGAVMVGQMWQGDYESRMAELQEQLPAAQQPSGTDGKDPGSSDSGSVMETAEFTNDEILSFLDEAQTAADAVAGIENQMVVDLAAYGKDSSKLDDVSKAIDQKQVYCGDRSFYSWVWYTWHDLDSAIQWTGYVAKDYAGTEIPVVWLCRNTDGQILAYARAIYHAEKDQFESFAKGVTTIGMKFSAYEDSPSESDLDDREVEEFMDDLKDLLEKNGILPEEMGGDFDLSQKGSDRVPAGEGTGVGSGIRVIG